MRVLGERERWRLKSSSPTPRVLPPGSGMMGKGHRCHGRQADPQAWGSPREGVTQIWPAGKWHLEARELGPVTSVNPSASVGGRVGDSHDLGKLCETGQDAHLALAPARPRAQGQQGADHRPA